MAIGNILTTTPIQQLWKESYIALGEIEVPMGIIIEDPWRDIANFIIIIALVLFLIFAHRRILEGLKIIFRALASQKMLLNIEKQSNIQLCRNTLFFFLTLCSSFVFANIAYATKIIGYSYTVPLKFAGITSVIFLFFLFRRVSLYFLAWVNRDSLFKLISKISLTYACIWYIAILCCFFVIKSIPSAPMGTMRYCFIYSILTILLVYFLQLYRIFVQKGFSHFFYFLYLCTLEILVPVLWIGICIK
jgi:hypothetical protein